MNPTEEQKAGVLRHIRYEIERCIFIFPGENVFPDFWVSHIVHARVLIDFFECQSKFKDDVLCTDFGFDARTLNVSEWYRLKMNKDLAHLTYERVKRTYDTQTWNVPEVLSAFYEVSLEFIDHILKNPPKLVDESELAIWRQHSTKLHATLKECRAKGIPFASLLLLWSPS